MQTWQQHRKGQKGSQIGHAQKAKVELLNLRVPTLSLSGRARKEMAERQHQKAQKQTPIERVHAMVREERNLYPSSLNAGACRLVWRALPLVSSRACDLGEDSQPRADGIAWGEELETH